MIRNNERSIALAVALPTVLAFVGGCSGGEAAPPVEPAVAPYTFVSPEPLQPIYEPGTMPVDRLGGAPAELAVTVGQMVVSSFNCLVQRAATHPKSLLESSARYTEFNQLVKTSNGRHVHLSANIGPGSAYSLSIAEAIGRHAASWTIGASEQGDPADATFMNDNAPLSPRQFARDANKPSNIASTTGIKAIYSGRTIALEQKHPPSPTDWSFTNSTSRQSAPFETADEIYRVAERKLGRLGDCKPEL